MGISVPNYLTLSDVAQMCHNQEIVPMVDEMAKNTTIFNALPWKQASDAMRDVTGKVTEYPTANWVGLDLGVKASKGSWTQVEEGLAMLESWSEINEKTYEISPHKEQTRWMNDQMHIRKLAMVAETGLLYGNPRENEAQPLGFLPRFNKITDIDRKADGVEYDYCTLSAKGANNQKMSSILLVAKGANCPTLLYPRYKANNGFMYRHFDFENTLDQFGGNVRVAKSQFQVTFGLSIADPRTAVRIANIDTKNATSVDCVRDVLYEALAAIPQIYRSSVELYTTKEVILALRKKYSAIVNPVTYPGDKNAIANNAYGDIYFDGILLHECESMLNTESTVL